MIKEGTRTNALVAGGYIYSTAGVILAILAMFKDYNTTLIGCGLGMAALSIACLLLGYYYFERDDASSIIAIITLIVTLPILILTWIIRFVVELFVKEGGEYDD